MRKESIGYLHDKARAFTLSYSAEKEIQSKIDSLKIELENQRLKTQEIIKILKENGPQVHILDFKPSRIVVIVELHSDGDLEVKIRSELR